MNVTNQGRDVRDYRRPESTESRGGEFRRFLLPYLILILSQLPLSLVYLKVLWTERSHYFFMPVAIAGCALFLLLRWPRKQEPLFFPSAKSDFLWWGGIVLGVLGTLFMSPWFAFAAMLALFGSLLARTNDRHVFGSLLPAIAPLVVMLQPPLGLDFDSNYGDIQLMAVINTVASSVAGDVLDLTSYPHNISDSHMEFGPGPLDAAYIGNGSLSVFTLLVITGLFIAWQRIPTVRGLLLLLFACFWSAAFEAMTLIVFAIGDFSFEYSLSKPGVANRVVQAVAMLGAGLMTLLSERLIAFICGPVDVQAIDEGVSFQDKLCRIWNKGVAGEDAPFIDVNVKKEIEWAKRRSNPPPAGISSLLWATGIVLAVGCVLQITSVGVALSRSGSSAFTDDQLALVQDTLPAEISGWDQINFQQSVPEFRNPHDTNEYRWTYTDANGLKCIVEIRQPVSGWRNPDRHLRRNDWQQVRKASKPATDPNNDRGQSDFADGLDDDLTIDDPINDDLVTDETGEPTDDDDPLKKDEADNAEAVDEGAQVTEVQGVDVSNLPLEDFRIDEVLVPVQAGYYRDTLANYRFALTAQLDGYGDFLATPLLWRNPLDFFRRSFSRLGNRSRPRLMSNRAMSISLYLDTIGPNTPEDRERAKELFKMVVQEYRKSMREGAIASEPLSPPKEPVAAEPSNETDSQ